MEDKFEALRLRNQLCFPLYAASKEVVRRYKPLLDELDLTYTQYITMMVMWECGTISAKEIGDRLYLDSGTMTPVLKSLEAKGYLRRGRSSLDERVLLCEITPEGMALQQRAVDVPLKMAACVRLSPEEGKALYTLLYKILGTDDANNN